MFYLRRDENEKAIADFSKIHDEAAEDLDAFHGLVEALTNMKRFEDAHRQLDKAVELDPASPANFTLRARIHALQEKIPEAIDDLSEALRLDERNLSALLMRAQLRQASGDPNAAKRDVERALIIQPGLIQAILMRSLISAAMGDYVAAASDLQDLLRSDPKNVEWRMRLAAVYAADKRPRKAIEVYTEILQDSPGNVAALRGRADALLSIGKQLDALQDYQNALSQDPKHSGVLNNLAWLLATSPDANIRDGQRSIALGTKACEETGYKEPHILSTLAAGYAEAGDFESAIKWSTKAVDLGEGEMKEQLQKELESYKQGKPWRELQEVDEKPEPTRGGGEFPF
jgi:tetratricopeptide (TPR) repeat protein